MSSSPFQIVDTLGKPLINLINNTKPQTLTSTSGRTTHCHIPAIPVAWSNLNVILFLMSTFLFKYRKINVYIYIYIYIHLKQYIYTYHGIFGYLPYLCPSQFEDLIAKPYVGHHALLASHSAFCCGRILPCSFFGVSGLSFFKGCQQQELMENGRKTVRFFQGAVAKHRSKG